MAINQNKPVDSDVLATDRTSLLALRKMLDYVPAHPALSLEALSAIEERLSHAEDEEIQISQALTIARNARIATGWELHNAMLRVKDAVASQYGPDSDAIQSLGLKKKSSYRRPARKRSGE